MPFGASGAAPQYPAQATTASQGPLAESGNADEIECIASIGRALLRFQKIVEGWEKAAWHRAHRFIVEKMEDLEEFTHRRLSSYARKRGSSPPWPASRATRTQFPFSHFRFDDGGQIAL